MVQQLLQVELAVEVVVELAAELVPRKQACRVEEGSDTPASRAIEKEWLLCSYLGTKHRQQVRKSLKPILSLVFSFCLNVGGGMVPCLATYASMRRFSVSRSLIRSHSLEPAPKATTHTTSLASPQVGRWLIVVCVGVYRGCGLGWRLGVGRQGRERWDSGR